MSAPQPAVTPVQPAAVDATGSYTHFTNGLIDEPTLRDAAALLHRTAGMAIPRGTACALWVHELIAYRDARGVLRGVHGFRFGEVEEAGARYRVVYAAFSVVDERAANRTTQLGQVGLRVYGRERMQPPRHAIVWALSPLCLPEEHFPVGGMQLVRQLVPSAASALPQTMRFFTDETVEQRSGDALPACVEQFIVDEVKDQRQTEKDAQMGRLILRPLWKRFGAGIAGAALAAGALMITLTPRSTPETAAAPEPVATRAKGSPVLHVFRQTTAGSEELTSGSSAAIGDHLRFAADLPAESRVSVIGVSPTGEVYTAWPMGAAAANPVFGIGEGHVLDGAVSLDGAPGTETFYLVTCPAASPSPVCTSHGAGQDPTCPVDCRLSPFALAKAASAK